MIAEITAGLGSLNAAMGLLKALNATANQATINQVKLDLQEHIFAAREALSAAREAQTASLDRIRQLEQQIVQFEDWERQKERYQLQDVGNGCMAYSLKAGMENGEPPHSICAQCYQARRKSILVPTHIPVGRAEALQCHVCHSELVVQGTDLRGRR